MRHRLARNLGALAGVMLLGACALTTSFDGFTGGSRDGGEGESASPTEVTEVEAGDAADASETSEPTDAGDEDGTVDAAPDADAGGSAYRAAVLEDGPVAYWRLADKTPTIAADELGLHPGQYQQASKVTMNVPGATGDDDKAVTFDGVGAVSIGDAFDFAGQAFSVELWFKPPATITGYPRVISKETNAPKYEGWHLEMNDAFKISFGIHHDGESSYVEAPAALAPGQFSHVVATFDLTTMRIYVDGVKRDEGMPGPSFSVIDTKENLVLAAMPALANALPGTLDDVALYDKALTDARISAHYAAAKR